MLRRLLAVAILLAPLAEATGAARWAASGHEDRCAGHACACVRHCPPKKPAGRSCHDSEAPAMKAACQHGGAAVTAAAYRPFVLPRTDAQPAPEGVSGLVGLESAAPAEPTLEIESPPPRTSPA
jgi:hypothetical protein